MGIGTKILSTIVAVIVAAILSYPKKSDNYAPGTLAQPSIHQMKVDKLLNFQPPFSFDASEIKQGVIDEDSPDHAYQRAFNHFQHWQTGEGLSSSPFLSLPAPLPVKQWVLNSSAQSAYPHGDHSWEKVKEEFRNSGAGRNFGHLYHLIADLTVPAHVHLATHPFSSEILEILTEGMFWGDFYETWTDEHKHEIIDSVTPHQTLVFNSLEDLLNSLAHFTGSNFYSDTNIDGTIDCSWQGDYCYRQMEGQEVALLRKGFLRDFPDTQCLHSYFKVLGTKAVEYGAAALNILKTYCTDDSFEPNDSLSAARLISVGTIPNLKICPGNPDWFKVNVSYHDIFKMQIDFTRAAGELDIALYDSAGNQVGTTLGSQDYKYVGYVVPSQNTALYGKISGHTSVVSNPYSLTVSVSRLDGGTRDGGLDGGIRDGGIDGGTCQDDSYEQNDSLQTAKTITAGTISNLKICPNDEDWYKISVPSNNTLKMQINFTHSAGDLDMGLYDSNGNQLDYSTSVQNSETVEHTPSQNATLYGKVYGWQGASNTYSLASSFLPLDGGLRDGGCVPSPEILNGLDDNCNGQIDEGFVNPGNPQVTLFWNNAADLDLHVYAPDNCHLYYNTPSCNTGALDRDANANCNSSSNSPPENIYWTPGQAPSGQYQIEVHYFKECNNSGSTPYTLSLSHNNLVSTYHGTLTPNERKTVTTFTH